MKIQITISAFDDNGDVIKSETGEISAKSSALDIRQWCMETFISIKMAAIKLNTQHERKL